MAISITKLKAPKSFEKVDTDVAVPEVAVKKLEDYSLEELADSYGSLEDQIAAAKQNPIYVKFDLVAKELAKRLKDEMEAEDTAEIQGEHWLLEVGACAKNPRAVKDLPAIKKMLGEEAFLKLVKVNLGDLDKYLLPEQLAKVVDSDTGFGTRRTITAKFLG